MCLHLYLCVQVCVQCGYELSVTFHSSNNSKDILANRVNCNDLLACDGVFRFCVRPLGAPVNITSDISDVATACSGEIESITHLMDNNSALRLNETQSGSSNLSVKFNGTLWVRR